MKPFEDPAITTEALFKDLVHTHQKRLYWFVLQKIGNAADSEDLTQQAFVEAANALAQFRGGSELSTWLYGIAMNLVRNYLTRAPSRRHQFESDDLLLEMAASGPDAAEQLELTQSISYLQREINDLPEDMQQVLLLVALDGLSYEEASVLLAIPVGTVRSRVSRARSTLRKRLEESGMPLGF